jgi:hypothetical protein
MRVLIFLFSFFIIYNSFAQESKVENEIGFWVGGANYFGDLNNNTSFKGTGPAGGLYLRNNIGSRIALKHSLNFGIVQFADRWSPNEFNQQRNLSFRTNIYEISSQFEFNFLKYIRHSIFKRQGSRWTPFITIGISLFNFSPQGRINDQWYDLQPLGTEGQNDPSYSGKEKYSTIAWAIPIGGGVKYNISRFVTIGIDIANRKTFTDYLDDVSGVYTKTLSLPEGDKGIAYRLADRSGEVGAAIHQAGKQRGTSSKADDYILGGVTISYTFWKYKCNY